jgi:hypothetical protein
MPEPSDEYHAYEVKGKRVVIKIYTVAEQLYYDYSINEILRVKRHRANKGETKQQLLERLDGIVRNSDPAL